MARRSPGQAARTPGAAAWLALLLATGGAPAHATQPASVARIDPASRVDFVLTTRWGQRLDGRFGAASGEVRELADGRREVHLRIDARSVEILDHPRYTAISRGPRFFEVDRYPELGFVSDPYAPRLLREGGTLPGLLRVHGVQRRTHFTLQPGGCARPGIDCDILGTGSVRRSDFGLDGWRMAVREEVRFQLRVRVAPLDPGSTP